MTTIGICLAGKVDFDLNLIARHYKIKTWVAVDGGYDHLKKHQCNIEVVIGDMDSIDTEIQSEYVYPSEKDETDFELAIDYVNKTYRDTQIIVCGVYDDYRLEHFISNLKLMSDNMIYLTKHNLITQCSTGHQLLNQQTGGFSFFAKKDVDCLWIKNAKYELNNYHLKTTDNLTISNEFVDGPAEITFKTGVIQIFRTNELFNK